MKKVYSVILQMYNGKMRVNEWDIIKETPKTVVYGHEGEYAKYKKNKDVFCKVNLGCKSESAGLWQDAYILLFAETEEEAIQKAVPIFRKWVELLNMGLNQALLKNKD